jgi:hypothetical protein
MIITSFALLDGGVEEKDTGRHSSGFWEKVEKGMGKM